MNKRTIFVFRIRPNYYRTMINTLLFSNATLSRMGQVEVKRAQFFQNLANERCAKIPTWLGIAQRWGIARNLFYSKQSNHAKYLLAASALREFHRCVVKWMGASLDASAKDPEVQLLVRLFSKMDIFSDGQFDVTKESLPLYNAAVLEVAKFFVLEAPVMNDVLRKSNVGTRVERNDIVNALKEHWSEFRMPKKSVNSA